MKILAERKIRHLFYLVFLFAVGLILFSAVVTGLKVENGALYIFAYSVLMGISIIVAMYMYFSNQYKIMESAVEQIKEYVAGNQSAGIECDNEGEMYRLFHEVNSLVSILNAHAENEERAKRFMKDTISDISHQLKTPLAALNIYNGIIQEESEVAHTVKEFASLSEIGRASCRERV